MNTSAKLDNDLKNLRLSPAQARFLESRRISTLDSLLHTYPLRYTPIKAYAEWEDGEEVLFEGLVEQVRSSQRISRGRIVTRIQMTAWNQTLDVSLFSFGYYPKIGAETRMTVCGTYHAPGSVTAIWTSQQALDPHRLLYPNYSLPLKTRRDTMIRIMDKALSQSGGLQDRVPASLRKKYRLYPLQEALQAVHQPSTQEELIQGIRALKYEEFLCFHCARLAQSAPIARPGRLFDQKQMDDFVQNLPYPLTSDQKSGLEEILNDLRSEKAMYRLLQGDVGCGKTVVAAAAIQAAVLSGGQAALLAPTEILARQHVRSLQKLGLEVSLFCSSLKTREKRKILEGLKNGSIQAVVGTHALLQPEVEFERLELVVADEQQRFGVLQRRALIEKGAHPDVLLMSATPIPRTAAHFLYGDIDLTSIRTMPPGRQAVKTHYYQTRSMKPVLERILEGIEEEGRQVYVVCPAIENNPEEAIAGAREIFEGMQSVLGKRVSIDLLHGKMKTEVKEEIMGRFGRGETQILVATTVIEVGIDVANATMMVIYDAHRFGLSALHQLRGRCARGSLQGECYLLSASRRPEAVSRLKKMETIDNGFDLAEYDLQLRGPGDLLGTRQSGLPAFILGDASRDLAMMNCCAKDAREILDHPENPENRPMLASIRRNALRPVID